MPIKSVMVALLTTTNKHFYNAFDALHYNDNNKYHTKNIEHVIITLFKNKSMPKHAYYYH